ncbi:MAG: 2-C-methyl-D-erythritol 4-phosphate cytidylyltransferase, partial [Deltaproteobacteria bacterium]|nr:2-C-methyl-D-erythritol 4-phosphate cytidylyltransferase [Deltaproteobacteria bacterium]
EAVVREARVFGAAIAALPVRDTVKLAGVDGAVEATLAREGVWLAQTPQAFDGRLLRQAHRQALRAGVLGTDDAALVERLGVKVRLVRGSEANFKVTTPEDLTLSQALVGAQEVRR